MTQIHNVRPQTKKRGVKRVGRGGKRGTYSGKGQKGQKSRAGHNLRPAQRDILKSIPKLRGFKNKPKQSAVFALSLSDIQKINEKTISRETLLAHKVVSRKYKRVKIVGTGSLTSPKEIVGIPASKSATEKIKAAGGSIL